MHHLLRISIVLSIALVISGCASDQPADNSASETTDSSTDSRNEGLSTDDGDAALDPADAFVGTWQINADATKASWSEENSERFNSVFGQELLGMTLIYNADNTFRVIKGTDDASANWAIKTTTEDSVTIEVFEEGNNERRLDWRMTFNTPDQLVYQSSEDEFASTLVFNRE